MRHAAFGDRRGWGVDGIAAHSEIPSGVGARSPSLADHLLTRSVDKIGGAGNYWFDATRRFDGGGFVLPVDPETGLTEADVYPYCGVPPNLGRACLDLFGDPTGVTFLDLGCGKGRMLALAAERGYRRCEGVELDSSLATIARRNLSSSRLRHVPSLAAIASVVHADAREYRFPEEPLAIFLNNPFAVPILQVVLDNLGASLASAPRPVTVVLMRRVYEDPANDSPTAGCLADAPFLRGGPAAPAERLTRFVLRGYALWRFTSVSRTD